MLAGVVRNTARNREGAVLGYLKGREIGRNFGIVLSTTVGNIADALQITRAQARVALKALVARQLARRVGRADDWRLR